MATKKHANLPRQLGLLLLAPLLAAPVGECDLSNGVDPIDGTPGEVVEVGGEEFWSVYWDNPVLGAYYNLEGADLGGGFAASPFNGISYSWIYSRFELNLELNDAYGTSRLDTWPSASGTYGNEGLTLPFSAHGARLAPRITGAATEGVTTAVAKHDLWNAAEATYTDDLGNSVGRIQLHERVALVPVRTVVLWGGSYSDEGGSYPALPSTHILPQFSGLLLDDLWLANEARHDEPTVGLSPDYVLGQWQWATGKSPTGQPKVVTLKQGNTASGVSANGAIQPDKIFDQCGIQFREVGFHTCEVPNELLWPTYGSTCPSPATLTARVSSLATYVHSECDVPNDPSEVLLMLGGRAVRPGCANVLGGEDGGNIRMSADSINLNVIVSHELGHALSLPHEDSCETNGERGNLMCDVAGTEMRDSLSAAQCEQAYSAARSRHENYW